MEKSIATVLEGVISRLTDKIDHEASKINDKNFLKNMTALKKLIDTADKLILLNEKINILKQVETCEQEDLCNKDKIMIENYFKARMKPVEKDDSV